MSAINNAGALKVAKMESSKDYIRFRKEMADYLATQGYGRLLPGESQASAPILREGEVADTFEDRQDRWEEKQVKARAAILSRLGTIVRSRVDNRATYGTVALVWDKLQEFKPRGSAAFQSLIQDWDSATLGTCDHDVTKLAAKLRTTRDDLLLLDETCTIAEPLLINKFLTSLGPTFDVFLTAFYQQYLLVPERDNQGTITKEAVTFDEAVMAAQREQQSQKLREGNISLLLAPQTKCSHCRKNHPTDKCYSKFPHLAPKGWHDMVKERRARKEERRKRGNNNKETSLEPLNHNASLAAVQSETPAFDFTFMTYNPDIPTVPEGNFEPSYLSQEFGATVEPPNP
ncbi:hypothetical protein F5B17DRAFT_436675, partial [Nemania serpens]